MRLIECVPSWFLPNAEVDERLSLLDTALFEAWVAAEVQRLQPLVVGCRPLDVALRTIAEVNHRITGRPLQSRTSADSLSESEFFDRSYARLLFGYTNCEGLAYLVYRLSKALQLDVTIVETQTEFSHTLIVLKDQDGWTILDPYSDFHHYHVEGFPLATVMDDPSLSTLRPYPESPEYDSLGYPEGSIIEHGLFPGAGALRSRRVVLRFERDSVPSLAEAGRVLLPRGPTDVGFLTSYLRLRHEHLWNDRAPAATYAALAVEHRIGGFSGALLGALDRAAG